ncbi:MAG: glycoside hydrolase family 68 protein [Sphingomonas sp.]
MPTAWFPERVATIGAEYPSAPIITAADATPIIPGLDLWDMWPVQALDGSVAAIAGGALWISLSAPVLPDPVERHGIARLRLLHAVGPEWRDLGNLLPDGLSPGSREWSGSTILDADGGLRLYFTAAGRRGEPSLTFEQRLFETRAALTVANGAPRLSGWTPPRQIVASDGVIYDPANQAEGAVGAIKAFRDPGFFRDPADGRCHLLFAGSLAASASRYNGAIGIVRATDETLDRWELLPPIVTADGLNNELERPHVLYREGRYFLFWSTQGSVFDPAGPAGPTGLYGMVADSLFGPYAPINGSGLVLGNPREEPMQAYSWLVLPDLTAISFVDAWGLGGRAPADAADARAHFGGTIAPPVRIALP